MEHLNALRHRARLANSLATAAAAAAPPPQAPTCKGLAPGGHLPQQYAKGVDVAGLAAAAVHQMLRRHVRESALEQWGQGPDAHTHAVHLCIL